MSLFFIDPNRINLNPLMALLKQATHFDSISGSQYPDSAPGAAANSITKTTNSAWNTGAPTKFSGNNYFPQTSPQSIGLTPSTLYDLDQSYWTLEVWTWEYGGSLHGIMCRRRLLPEGWDWKTNGFRGKINGVWTDPYMTWTLPSASTWHHMALVRSGSEIRMFVDGIRVATQTGLSTIDATASIDVVLGQTCSPASGSENMLQGFMDDFQFYASNSDSAAARYNLNFSVPTTPFINSAGGVDFSLVSLLMHMDGTNGSTSFPDNSSNALTVTANGNAAVSTTQYKYGDASAYFDGTGDYLSIPTNAVLSLTGDFTIEFWCRVSTMALAGIMDNGVASFTTDAVGLVLNHPSYLSKITLFRNPSAIVSTDALSTNTWYHVAFVRFGTTVTAYLNGVASTPATLSTTVDLGLVQTRIGKYWGADFNGYIDDLRITKNFARYTANFTPPTAAFPNS